MPETKKKVEKEDKLPAFPENARIPPNQPDQVEVLEYDKDGEFVGQTLVPLADFDPATVPSVEADPNAGGFVQVDGHGWTDEELAAKEEAPAEAEEEEGDK